MKRNINDRYYWNNKYRKELLRKDDTGWQLDRFTHIISYINCHTGKVLDLACGTGFLSRFLKSRSPELDVYGIDFSYVAIDFNLKYTGDKEHYKEGEVYKIPFPDNMFDFVIGGEILEHLEEPDKFFKEIFRVLKQGGTMILSTPNIKKNKQYFSEEHVKEYLSEEIEPIIKRNKFNEYMCFESNEWWMILKARKI